MDAAEDRKENSYENHENSQPPPSQEFAFIIDAGSEYPELGLRCVELRQDLWMCVVFLESVNTLNTVHNASEPHKIVSIKFTVLFFRGLRGEGLPQHSDCLLIVKANLYFCNFYSLLFLLQF